MQSNEYINILNISFQTISDFVSAIADPVFLSLNLSLFYTAFMRMSLF